MTTRIVLAPLDTAAAKAGVIGLLESIPTMTVTDALDYVGRSMRTYEAWRANDDAFRKAIDAIWEARRKSAEPEPPTPFPTRRRPLPTGTCGICSKEGLLVRGPSGHLRCLGCAGAPHQHAQTTEND